MSSGGALRAPGPPRPALPAARAAGPRSRTAPARDSQAWGGVCARAGLSYRRRRQQQTQLACARAVSCVTRQVSCRGLRQPLPISGPCVHMYLLAAPQALSSEHPNWGARLHEGAWAHTLQHARCNMCSGASQQQVRSGQGTGSPGRGHQGGTGRPVRRWPGRASRAARRRPPPGSAGSTGARHP